MSEQRESEMSNAVQAVVDRIKEWTEVPTDVNKLRTWAHIKVSPAELKARSGGKVPARQLSLW